MKTLLLLALLPAVACAQAPTRVNVGFNAAGYTDAKAFTASTDCLYAYVGPLSTSVLQVWDVSAATTGVAPTMTGSVALGVTGNPYWAEYWENGGHRYVWVYVDASPGHIVLVNVDDRFNPVVTNLNGAGSIAAQLTSFTVTADKLVGCTESATGTPTTVTRLDLSGGLSSIVVSTLSMNSGEDNAKGGILNWPFYYVMSIASGGSKIITVNASTTPMTRITALSAGTDSMRHPGICGRWMYVPLLTSPATIKAYDISNPVAPVAGVTITLNSTEDFPRTAHCLGGRLYVSLDGSAPAKLGVIQPWPSGPTIVRSYRGGSSYRGSGR